jgi:hypothetical protein
MTQKITDLVHAGKYSEAQQLTTGLLIAFPNDQRLIKAKALIEKLLLSGDTSDQAAIGISPAPLTPTTNAIPLAGMDKIDYNGLMELARQAQQTTDPDDQARLLQQFMDQSHPFLQKHPDQILLWQIRAASAISLNEPMEGFEAGQSLIAAGAADSSDTVLQRLLGQLRNKGWLDKQGAEDAQAFNQLRSLKLRLVYGTWSTGHVSVHMKAAMTLTVAGLGEMKEPVIIHLENTSPTTCRLDGGATGTMTIKPGDAAGGIYTSSRTATLTDWHSYAVPCTVNLSVVDKNGKTINSVTIGNGY